MRPSEHYERATHRLATTDQTKLLRAVMVYIALNQAGMTRAQIEALAAYTYGVTA